MYKLYYFCSYSTLSMANERTKLVHILPSFLTLKGGWEKTKRIVGKEEKKEQAFITYKAFLHEKIFISKKLQVFFFLFYFSSCQHISIVII